MYGIADTAAVSYVGNGDAAIGVTNLDVYAGDTWKVRKNLTLTYGLRATWDSNMISQRSAYSQIGDAFFNLSHDVNEPIKDAVFNWFSNLLPSTQAIVLQPRGALAWEVAPKTVIRLGAGKFSDLFPYVLADMGLTNPPNVNSWVSGVSGSVPGMFAIAGTGDGIDGSGNNDVVTAMAQANRDLLSGFANGATSCNAASHTSPCLSRINITAFPHNYMPYPYFLEWSAGIEHQFSNSFMIKAQYVGTKATNMAYTERPNNRQLSCPGCFAPYVFGARPDDRFGTVTQWQSGANSNYNALQVTVQKRMSHGLTFTADYSYSHCLDEISNGGRFAFATAGSTSWIHPILGELGRMYGNCDFDVPQSLNGSYVYQLPKFAHGGILGQVVNGWQVSGDAFLHSGFPVTAVSATTPDLPSFSGSIPQFANAVPGFANMPKYFKNTAIPGITMSLGEIQWLNPLAFTSVINPDDDTCVGGNDPAHCQFGNAGRNTLRAPNFKWNDFFLTKRFKLRESMSLRFEAQFYNLFNHPNFGYPSATFGVPGIADTVVDKGVITSPAQPPTSLLGSGLGGDSSVRMIALHMRLEF